MDWLSLYQKGNALVKKYAYVWIVLVLGLILMLLPNPKQEKQLHADDVPVDAVPVKNLADELGDILSRIEGAGKVQVLLTIEQGERIQYQYDEEQMSGGGQSRQTVIISDSNKNQEGLIRQVNPPAYRGAVVLCQGADSAAVRLMIIEAVANATGLSTDRISVLKMK